MTKINVLDILYSKEKSPLDFNFDALMMPDMFNYISMQDVEKLYNIATSLKYADNINKKYAYIASILEPRGFKKFGCGTNRIVYKYLDSDKFLLKIAIDKVGLSNNPDEYKNQFLLQPFVTKMFQVSPGGVVGTVERVQPITSRREYLSIASNIFELLTNKIIGKYVVSDLGTKYFMNYGIRTGFGPVLLDYPDVYELDGGKLRCQSVNRITGEICNGEIDYDDGFNELVCTKCHRVYKAKELERKIEDKLIYLNKRGKSKMKIKLFNGNTMINEIDTKKETKTIQRERPNIDIVLNKEDNFQKKTIQREQIKPKEEYNVESTFIPHKEEKAIKNEVKIIKNEETKPIETKDEKIQTEKQTNEMVEKSNESKKVEEERTERKKEEDKLIEKYAKEYGYGDEEHYQKIPKKNNSLLGY